MSTVTALRRCPACHSPLQLDHIGGTTKGHHAQPSRTVWLCPTCWTVHPDAPALTADAIDIEPERRRDLA